jgi:hypothetical protein
MQTRITIAIAIAMRSLFALMFWQTVIDATENDAAVASAQLKPQYVVSPDPYLPNKRASTGLVTSLSGVRSCWLSARDVSARAAYNVAKLVAQYGQRGNRQYK